MKTLTLSLIARLVAGACVLASAGAAAASNYSLPALSYHDVVLATSSADEPETVSVDSLVRQFAWLQAKGYIPVTMAQVEAASRGGAALPERAVLLTFDDGYASFYTHVMPLLRAYRWPATLAVIGTRIGSEPAAGEPAYLNAAQLREIAASGLVQFANHTYDLHRGIVANPWGNAQPSAVTRAWAGTGSETDEQWTRRVAADLRRNQERLFELTGHYPTSMVWPYGRHNEMLQALAREQGLTLLFSLESGVSDVRKEGMALKRYLVGRDDREGAIMSVTEGADEPQQVIRAVALRVQDLQPVAVDQPEQRLSAALPALVELQGNIAVLDPLVRMDGQVVGAMFETSALEVKLDYANRVAALTTGKAGYTSWLSFPLSPASYRSLSQEQVLALVEDAAKAMPAAGLLVEDADQVDSAVVIQAISRVRKWRAGAALTLGVAKNNAIFRLKAAASAAGAKYVWVDAASASQALLAGVPVIQSFSTGSAALARKSVQAGVSHVAITGLPADARGWADFFSLRSMPQRRIEVQGD